MTKAKVIYVICCTFVALLGLFPAIYLNVRPWWHHDWGIAASQFVYSLVGAGIPLFIFSLPRRVERIFFAMLWLGAMRVSIANGIESISLTRTEMVSGVTAVTSTNAEWTTRIEAWGKEKSQLEASYIPVDNETKYTPTSQEVVDAKRERRDAANREKDAACKVSRISNACTTATERAEKAQTAFEQATQNYGLTLRVDKIEKDIKAAQANVKSEPPDFLKKARSTTEGAWFDILGDREIWSAGMAEAAAAGAPKLFVYIVGLLFLALLGEGWKEPRSSLNVESTQEMESTRPLLVGATRKKPQAKLTASTGQVWGALWLPGVRAWIDSVRPIPGGPCKRYSPAQAFPHYVEFCRERGHIACGKPQVLGTIITKHIDIFPVANTGGMRWYELNLGAKLALVKAGGE